MASTKEPKQPPAREVSQASQEDEIIVSKCCEYPGVRSNCASEFRKQLCRADIKGQLLPMDKESNEQDLDEAWRKFVSKADAFP